MAYSIYIKHMFTTVGCFEDAMLLQLPGFTFASSFPYSNCVILVVRSQFLSLCKTNKQTTLRAEVSVCLFVFFVPSKHWFLSCMVFSVYDVVRVAFPSRRYKTNWLSDGHTSDAKDIMNAKNHAREKPVLAGYKQTDKQTNQDRMDSGSCSKLTSRLWKWLIYSFW